MTSVEAHYRDHLGRVYDWMLGDFDEATARPEALLRCAGVGPGDGPLVVDLGCGSGLQSVPLLRFGYHVVAIRAQVAAAGLDIASVAVERGLMTIVARQPRPGGM